MKTKSILVGALAAMTLFSCSKGDDNGSIDGKTNFSLALNVSTKVMGRAIEDDADITALNINSLVIELYDVNKKIIGAAKSLTADEIAAVTAVTDLDDQSRIIFPNVSKEAVYVKLYAFQKSAQASPDLTLGVNTFQNGFDAVPFFPYAAQTGSSYDAATGLITINKSTSPAPGPGADDKKIWTVDAKMSAYLARFEVKGTLTAEDLDPIAGGTPAPWATIAVTGVYINNIKDKVVDAAPTLIEGNNLDFGAGDWVTGHPYTTAGNWSKMYNVNTGEDTHAVTNTPLFTGATADKVAAYQIFPQGSANAATATPLAAPHIIVRLLITPDKAIYDKDPYYAFITLSKFKILAALGGVETANYLNLVERGKVYRIDLTSLAKLKPGDLDPDPENSPANLYVKILIENWTEIFLKPEL